MHEVKIDNAGNGKIRVATPYHPDWPKKARNLGGSWKDPHWVFDARDETRVRELCRTIFGTDDTPTQTVTVRYDISHKTLWFHGVWLFGRRVLYRDKNDDPCLGDGVVLHSGGFKISPNTEVKKGTIIEIRDVPAGHPDLALDHVVETFGDVDVDVAALRTERERLAARLAEIDATLADHGE